MEELLKLRRLFCYKCGGRHPMHFSWLFNSYTCLMCRADVNANNVNHSDFEFYNLQGWLLQNPDTLNKKVRMVLQYWWGSSPCDLSDKMIDAICRDVRATVGMPMLLAYQPKAKRAHRHASISA